MVSEDEFFDFTYWYTYYPIRVLYGRYQGIRVLHGRGTTKIDFRVAAEPDDELSKFHSDRKFAFVSEKLSMLLHFEKIVVWLRENNFSILRASTRVSRVRALHGWGAIRVGVLYGQNHFSSRREARRRAIKIPNRQKVSSGC